MQTTTDKGIEDILFDQGKIPQDKLSVVKMEAINTGKPVEDILLEYKFVSIEDIAAAKGALLNIPFIDLTGKAINPEVLQKIPEPVARRYTLIPFEYNKETSSLSVAMSDPLDLQVVEFIEKKSGSQIKPYISTVDNINSAIAEQYSKSLSADISAAVAEASVGTVEAKSELKDLNKAEEIIKEAPVAKIVSTLLEYAMKARASDIHIEALDDRTRVRYRIDGILQERLVLPKKIHESVVARIKILSNLKIDEKRIPQDGRFSFKLEDDVVDLRISTLPTVHGEKVVMRLLPKAAAAPTLSDLGLRGTALRVFEEAITRPNGIILITGPTGSGKTTTLFAALSKINSSKVNIVTLEDPVEYQIPGVNQVQINPTAGLTFASGLRSFLRQHTNSSAGALPRLLDMGAETFLLASSMTAVAAQRVVRRICPDCKTEYDPPEPLVEDIKAVLGTLHHVGAKVLSKEEEKDFTSVEKAKKFKLFKGKGCDKCGDSGYKGRIAVFEVLPVTDKIGKLILERQPSSVIEKTAIENGMITMKQDGYLKAVEGITTIEEVLRAAQD